MTAKTHAVRCTGRCEVSYPTPGNRTVAKTAPCGWKGQRTAYDIDGEPIVNRDIPCPRCGGAVDLAPHGNGGR